MFVAHMGGKNANTLKCNPPPPFNKKDRSKDFNFICLRVCLHHAQPVLVCTLVNHKEQDNKFKKIQFIKSQMNTAILVVFTSVL